VKLAPVGEKLEARARGPNVTPGYWRDETLTAAVFDDEGFYRLGDAVRCVDPDDPAKGLVFDGRLAEDFKLSTGTWVSVGPLRARWLAAAEGDLQDVVIAGHDRAFVAALLFPNAARCRALCPDLPAEAPLGAVLDDARVRERFERLLRRLAAESTGSSTFVARALVVATPPSLDAREMTDKGSLNQQVVLENRHDDVEELYAPQPSRRVLQEEP
jgi:feruloyl-CoA synthase